MLKHRSLGPSPDPRTGISREEAGDLRLWPGATHPPRVLGEMLWWPQRPRGHRLCEPLYSLHGAFSRSMT